MKRYEAMHKRDLNCWHSESDNEKMTCRIPNEVNSFEVFWKKKSCKVKDHAVEVVAKMCRLHCVNMKELQEEVDNDKT